MNVLKKREQFEQALHDYHISEDGKRLLSSLQLVLLGGPSAAGRNTIIERLIKTGRYRLIVSDTTRLPRVNNGVKELNGVTYWFRSESQVLDELKQGEFLEAEIIHDQQVSGISLRELKLAIKENKIAVTDIEIRGFNNILSSKPDAVGLLVLPPSFEEWMSRLRLRTNMPASEILNRLRTGARIFSEAVSQSPARIVINDDLERAVAEIDALAKGAEEVNGEAKLKLARDLLAQTERYLATNS
ncbi:MAG: guanylate kinase [Candidatus Saccharimonadales bacterium]